MDRTTPRYCRDARNSAQEDTQPPCPREPGMTWAIASLSLAILTPLCLSPNLAVAKPLSEPQSQQEPAQSTTQLFVNPDSGSDSETRGNYNNPFKTITQALRVAKSGTVIQLAPGTYSSQTGETFPLRLQPGVTIQGDPNNKGEEVVIAGGNFFLSPTFARQNVTLLGANQATLRGVTVTNPNPRGYGLWIESSSPTVVANTFTGSTHDGVAVTGTSQPLIRDNIFRANGANGITIYGRSQPELRENLFENTGFGINIGQRAAPLITDNRVTGNKDGIVVQAKAQPVLRNNVIEGNSRDGVVAITFSFPDLGIQGEPGNNVFRNNGRHDINSKAAKEIIPAFGNQLSQDRSVGRIDYAGTVTGPSLQPRVARKPRPAPTTAVAALSPATKTPAKTSSLFERSLQPKTSPDQEAGTPVVGLPKPATTQTGADSEEVIIIPVPPPESPAAISRPAPRALPVPPPASAPAPVVETTTVLPTPSAPTRPLPSGATLPVLQPASPSDLLPVPNSAAPLGNPGSRQSTVTVPSNPAPNPSAGNPPPPPTLAQVTGLRYRVIVDATSEQEQARVKSLAPGAFRTRANGRTVMQAGAFHTRDNADELLQRLKSNGLEARTESFN